MLASGDSSGILSRSEAAIVEEARRECLDAKEKRQAMLRFEEQSNEQREALQAQIASTEAAKEAAEQEKRVRQVLTNQETTLAVQKQLPERIILARIEASECDFDLAVESLAALDEARFPKTAITAMIRMRAVERTAIYHESSHQEETVLKFKLGLQSALLVAVASAIQSVQSYPGTKMYVLQGQQLQLAEVSFDHSDNSLVAASKGKSPGTVTISNSETTKVKYERTAHRRWKAGCWCPVSSTFRRASSTG